MFVSPSTGRRHLLHRYPALRTGLLSQCPYGTIFRFGKRSSKLRRALTLNDIRNLTDSRNERRNYLILVDTTSILSEANGVAFAPAPFLVSAESGENDTKSFFFSFIRVKTERFVGDLHSSPARSISANGWRHIDVMSACAVQGADDSKSYRTRWPAIPIAIALSLYGARSGYQSQ